MIPAKYYENEPKLPVCRNDVWLMVTRFNDETYEENRNYCEKYKWPCLYSNPSRLHREIKPGAKVFILELNIVQNTIVGIGEICNTVDYNHYKIYTDLSFNKGYNYRGVRHMKRENISDQLFMESLDGICCKGRGHLKRGVSMSLFPIRILNGCYKNNLDVIEKLEEIFKRKTK